MSLNMRSISISKLEYNHEHKLFTKAQPTKHEIQCVGRARTNKSTDLHELDAKLK